MLLRLGLAAAITATASIAVATPAGPGASSSQGASNAPAGKLAHSATIMGTLVELTLHSHDEYAAAAVAAEVFAEFRRIDRLMTTWTTDSEVSKINAAAGHAAVTVSEETFAVIARAQEMAAISGGLFDITVGAYAGLWKFDEDMDGAIPTPGQVALRRRLVNWRDVVLDASTRTVKLRRAGMRITLGGIAKGYAVDRGVALLRAKGFTQFILKAGGDMYVGGRKGDTPWRVGIRDPRGPASQIFASAIIEDRAFSTSGDYERGFVKAGIRYHHILDPRTGRPAMATRSLTIVAPDAFTADAWSKIFFIAGATKTMALLKQHPELGVVIVGRDNKVSISENLRAIVTISRPPTPGI